MKVALIEDGRIVAASPGFLEGLRLASLDELAARGGLGLPAQLSGAMRVKLALPPDAPAEAELVPLQTGEGQPLLHLLQLVPPAPQTDWPFLAKLSHEVRTPLTSVIGFAELMSAESFGPLGHASYRGYVTDILASARHALSLLNDLLDLAQTRAGRIDLAPAFLDPHGLAREAMAAMQPLALKAGVALELIAEGSAIELLADRRSLKQILLNLLANALKWTPQGGRVQVIVRRAPGAGLTLAVSDTGAGMSAEALAATLADPFGPARPPRTAGGSGLGLPLARELAAANGASLAFDTAPGQGMRVTLRFGEEKLREIKVA